MSHITHSLIKKAMKEHHMIGEMLGGDKHGLSPKVHKKAIQEHHKLAEHMKGIAEHHGFGSLIGSLGRGLKGVSPFLKMGGKAVSGLGGIAQMFNDRRDAKAQREDAKAQHEAQMRMLGAQTQGVEQQNAAFKRQMEAQPQKKGGRTKRCK